VWGGRVWGERSGGRRRGFFRGQRCGEFGEARVRSLACPGWFGGQAARTLCAPRAVMAHSSPEPAAGLFGGACSEGGLVRRAGRAHFVRPESCDGSQQSRACGGLVRRGLFGGRAGSEGRLRALRALREL
jgi:hypothetical protein